MTELSHWWQYEITLGMKMEKPAFHRLCFTLLCISIAFPALATDCFQQSPGAIRQGENYYGLDNTTRLDDDTRDKLDSIYRKLQGTWQGSLQVSECLGTESRPRKNLRSYSLTTDISAGPDSSLLLKATRFDEEFRMRKTLERVMLGKTTPTFDIQVNNSNQISFSEKYRLSNKPRSREQPAAGNISKPTRSPLSSRLVENRVTLRLDEHKLTIIIEQYINGIFVSAETWELTPV